MPPYLTLDAFMVSGVDKSAQYSALGAPICRVRLPELHQWVI